MQTHLLLFALSTSRSRKLAVTALFTICNVHDIFAVRHSSLAFIASQEHYTAPAWGLEELHPISKSTHVTQENWCQQNSKFWNWNSTQVLACDISTLLLLWIFGLDKEKKSSDLVKLMMITRTFSSLLRCHMYSPDGASM